MGFASIADRAWDAYLDRHGEHQGEKVSELPQKLLSGAVKVEDITPLVVICFADALWVVFGLP